MDITAKELLMVFGTPLLLGIALFAALNWRKPVVFLGFFLWIHIEDLVRILLGNQMLVFFVKTVLFGSMLFGYFYSQFSRGRGVFWRIFPAPLALCLFFGLAIVQSLNPRLEHPVVPLVGFHAQFMYIPVFLLAYKYFDRESRVDQFLLFTFVLVAAESLLTIPQMVFGPQWWYSIVGKPDTLEMFVGRSGARAGEDFFRPCSIFANAGRFYQYLSVAATVLVGALFYFREPRARVLTYFCFVCVAIGLYTTSGRTTMYLTVLTLAVFLLLGFARRQLKLQIMLGLVAVTFAAFWVLPLILGDTAFYIKNLFLSPLSSIDPSGGDSVVRRIVSYAHSIYRAWAEGGWTGHGTGSNSLGLYFIGITSDGEEPGYAALIWEYGLAGLALWLLLMGALWFQSYRTYRRLKGSRFEALALSLVLLSSFAIVYQYIGYQIMQNYLVTIHFWALSGMLFALPRLQEESIRPVAPLELEDLGERLPSPHVYARQGAQIDRVTTRAEK